MKGSICFCTAFVFHIGQYLQKWKEDTKKKLDVSIFSSENKALEGTKTKVIKRVITKSQQESGNATYSISLSYGIHSKKNLTNKEHNPRHISWADNSMNSHLAAILPLWWSFFSRSSRAQTPHEVPLSLSPSSSPHQSIYLTHTVYPSSCSSSLSLTLSHMLSKTTKHPPLDNGVPA